MSERLPIKKTELENPWEVFEQLAGLRVTALDQRASYQESLKQMDLTCRQLRGVEVLITGRLSGMDGMRVDGDEPKSAVERLHVRIGSAAVSAYEGVHGHYRSDHLPFISLQAYTVPEGRLVCADMGVGDSGVTVELVETREVHL